MGKVQFLFYSFYLFIYLFIEFFASVDKIFILEGRLSTRL